MIITTKHCYHKTDDTCVKMNNECCLCHYKHKYVKYIKCT